MNIWASLKEEPTIFLFKKMWRFGKEYRKEMLLFWSMSIIARIMWLFTPMVFGWMINEIQLNGITRENEFTIYYFLFLLFASNIIPWFIHAPSRVMETKVGYKIDRTYKKYLYNAVVSLPLTWHTDHDSGNTIDRINKATDSLFDFSRNSFNALRLIINLLGTIVILFYYNISLSIFSFLALVFTLVVVFIFDFKIVPMYKARNKMDNRSQAKVFDMLSNITTLKILSIEEPVLKSVNKSWWESYDIYKKTKKTVEWKWFIGDSLISVVQLLPIAAYIYISLNNGQVVLAGTVSSLYLYLKKLDEVFDSFAKTYEDYMIYKSRLQNVDEIENDFESLKIKKRKNIGTWEKLEFNNIDFSYYDLKNTKDLDGVSFNISKGEKIALIGESGSGKTTVLKVLHGMYDSAKVSLKVNENKTNQVSFTQIDMKSTLVPQEPEVFSASILENLTLLLDFSSEEIEKAVEMAQFAEVVKLLPKKYESVVNEKGVNLSGGQKQRLALARALLFSKEKEIILLDESTSSVDPENEVKIYKNIFTNFPEKTILASIHKMNLLKYFDRIIIMEKGRIKDEGTFNELYERNIEFKKSWDEYVLENQK